MAGDLYERYFYPGTFVLQNLPNLTDEGELKQFERQVVLVRAAEAMRHMDCATRPSAETLKDIHRILFQDVYGWAGKIRTMELHKAGTSFAGAASEMSLDRVITICLQDVEAKPILAVAALAECWAGLNYEHPFVEGNGRATQIFMNGLAGR